MTLKNSTQSLDDRVRYILLVLACWMPLCLSASHAQETSLAWNFKQGDQFQVETTKLSKRTSTLDSRLTTIRSNVILAFNWTIDSVDDADTAMITQELIKFSIDIGDPAVPLQAIRYASDDDPADLSAAMRKLQRKSKPLIGLICVLQMERNGKINSIKLDPESEKKLEKLTNAPNLKALFSEKSLKKICSGSMLNNVPADSHENEEWSKFESEPSNDSFGELKIDHHFSAGSIEKIKGRKLINIVIDSKLSPSESDVEALKKPKAKNEVTQSLKSYAGSGSIVYDVDGEFFSGSQYRTEIKSERQYREKTIMTSLQSETRIKIEKK